MPIKIVEGRHEQELCAYCGTEPILSRVVAYTDGEAQYSKMRVFFPLDASVNLLRMAKKEMVIMTPPIKIKVEGVISKYKGTMKKLEKILTQYNPEIVERVRKGELQDDGIYFDYKYQGKYPSVLSHQKIIYNMMRYCDCAAILSDPGTCKTAPYLWAIDTRIQLGQVKRALIITLATLVPNIAPEIEMQAPHLTSVQLTGGAERVGKIINKTFKSKKRNMDYDIYIMSYESMRTYADIFPDDFFQMVVLDEAHRVGSPDSQQTKAIVKKFQYTKYKYIATGTLNANNLMSFFMPFRFMSSWAVPISEYYAFRQYYMLSVDKDEHVWVEKKGARKMVSRIISRLSVVFKKGDCLDLPELLYEKVEIELHPEARKVYDSINSELEAYIDNMCDLCDKRFECDRRSCDNKVAIDYTQTRLIKLRQITSGFYKNTVIEEDPITGKTTDKSNYIYFKRNRKLDALANYSKTLPADSKVIVWCTFVKSVLEVSKRLRKIYGKDSVITCYGNDNAFAKEQEFKKSKKARWIVAIDRKLGVGLNMQYSNYMLFYEKDYSLVKREQQLGRQHRKGQNNKVTAVDFSCINTTDREITECLQDKIQLSSELEAYSRIAKRNRAK